jgi:hypothetical protein
MLWEILLMGKGKKKRAAKRRNQMKNRNAIKEKIGKPIFFTLTHCSKKLTGVSNKYNYKANMHNLCFVGARFYNVKYQAYTFESVCHLKHLLPTGIKIARISPSIRKASAISD